LQLNFILTFSREYLFGVKNLLLVAVFDKHPEWLHFVVDFLIPVEVLLSHYRDKESRRSDGAGAGLELDLGELGHVTLYDRTDLRVFESLSNLLLCHEDVVVPLQLLLLFDSANDFGVVRKLRELPEWSHTLPHPSVDHLAQAQKLVRHLGMFPLQTYLKQSS